MNQKQGEKFLKYEYLQIFYETCIVVCISAGENKMYFIDLSPNKSPHQPILKDTQRQTRI